MTIGLSKPEAWNDMRLLAARNNNCFVVAASSLEPLELMQRLLRLAWQTHENIIVGKYLLALWQEACGKVVGPLYGAPAAHLNRI